MKHLFSIFTAVFAVLAFLVSCGGSEGSGDNGVYGYVTDYDTDAPIANAKVRLDPSGDTVLTNSEGYYEIRGVPNGDNYRIVVTKTGYYGYGFSVDDSDYQDYIRIEGRMVNFDVRLRKEY